MGTRTGAVKLREEHVRSSRVGTKSYCPSYMHAVMFRNNKSPYVS